ncbi:hypothetical protein OKW36_001031 [Paraburkholderia sp. MM5482-R1]
MQFPFELTDDRVFLHVGRRRFGVRHAVLDLVEQHQHEVRVRFRIVHGPRGHVDEVRPAIALDAHAARFDAAVRVQGLIDRGAQFQPQFRTHDGHDVVRRLAAGILQKTPGAIGQMNDFGFAAHQHAGRRILLDEPLMQIAERKAPAPRRLHRGHDRPRAHGAGNRDRQRRVTAYRHVRAIDAVALVDHGEHRAHAVGRLRAAEEQHAAGTQREVEHLQDFDLRFAVEVDQQVAAADHVEPRERRVAQHVMVGEQHVLAQLFLDPEMRGVPREELADARRRQVGGDRVRVHTGAREGNGALVDVGREYLKRHALGRFQRAFLQQHRQRIGFFARRAAHRPHADAVLFAAAFEQGRQYFTFEHVERFLVAEEIGDADQHVLQQRLGFFRVQMQIIAIHLQVGNAVDLQPAFDTPQNRSPFVMSEIVCGAGAQNHHDFAQRALGRLVDRVFLGLVRLRGRQMDFPRGGPQIEQPLRHLGRGHHEVGHAGRDCAARHAVVFGLGRVLHERDAAHFLDARQADRAVRARSRHHDAYRAFAVRLGERAEKQIDARAASFLGQLPRDAQVAVDHDHLERGRDQIDVVRFDRRGACDLLHGHAGDFLQQ